MQDAVVWSIKQFNGSQEYLMRAHFGLPSISAEDAREWKAPIQVLSPPSPLGLPLVCWLICFFLGRRLWYPVRMRTLANPPQCATRWRPI